MGTWGSSIWADDEALDVREAYKELIGEGLTSDQATEQLMLDFGVDLTKPRQLDEYVEWGRFWLFLAAAKWSLGRLDDANRDVAIEFIERGGDSDGFESARQRAERRKALDALLVKLVRKQKRPVKVPPPKIARTERVLGEWLSYRLSSGKFVIMRVIGFSESKYVKYPIVEILDWVGGAPPQGLMAGLARKRTKYLEETLERIRQSPNVKFWPGQKQCSDVEHQRYLKGCMEVELLHNGKIGLPAEVEEGFDASRWQTIGIEQIAEACDDAGAMMFVFWNEFDAMLERSFDLK